MKRGFGSEGLGWAFRVIAVALVYYAAARLGTLTAIAKGQVSAVWPAAGVTVASLLLLGLDIWPGVVLGAFFFTIGTGASFLTSAIIGVGAILEGALAVFFISRLIKNPYPFENSLDVFRYFAFAGAVSSAVGAAFGIVTLCFAGIGPWSNFGYFWYTWFLGDLIGILVISPALLTWARPLPKNWNSSRFVEAGLLAFFLIFVNLLIFRVGSQHSLGFLCVPILLWAGLRFEQHGAVTAIFVTCAMATWFTVHGHGPFAVPSLNGSLLVLQAFMGVTTMTVLVLSAAIYERHETERHLAEQAQELARSNADLEQFAYVASHDLQEPLRMISSYCQLLQRRYHQNLDPDADSFISYAVDGAKRMQELIDDLLTYSRIGRRSEPFQLVRCDEALSRAVANLKAAFVEKQVVLTQEPLPAVRGDFTQMTQLFQNLLSNSVKYCVQKPPKIHLWAETKDRQWVIHVRDNGIGIAPEHHERIFLIFQRLHSRDTYSGTGIGLAICKKIIERHGGRIWVESTEGNSSIFSFSIPWLPPVAPKLEVPEPGPAPVAGWRSFRNALFFTGFENA